MISIFWWLAAPVLLACLLLGTGGLVRRFPVGTGVLLATIYLSAAASLLFVVGSSQEVTLSLPWVPELGMDFALRMTSFSAWFAALIFALGASILLYAATYFKNHPRLNFLLICLLLFTTSMLGVVWSDNFYLLFLFWEGTSLLSFLLVGFHHGSEETRAKASQALLVTFFGGAAMLLGFVLLHSETGIKTISGLLGISLVESSATNTALVLIALGALTKSSQFPFHFWLPNAMAGPTPVSAYLHSATMVKAGVYLLAVLAPVFANHSLWTPLLVTSGLLTVFVSVARARREGELKAILAATTLSALGFLTMLAGIGTPAALSAFVIFLTAHALYKAPLFLSAGNLEKQFETRQIPELRGAIHRAPVTGAVIVFSLASLFGLPPLAGFLGKEYLLKAAWAEGPWLAVLSTLATVGVVYLGLRVLLPLLSRNHMVVRKHPLPRMMSVATVWPALIALSLMALHTLVNPSLFAPAAEALGGKEGKGFSYWHGWTPALGLGISAWILAALIAFLVPSNIRPTSPKSIFESGYQIIIEVLGSIGTRSGQLLERGTLSSHLSIILVLVGVLSIASLDMKSWPSREEMGLEESSIFIVLAPALAIATLIAAYAKKTLAILVSLGFVGLLIAFIFLWLSAPDLALTQLLAETLLIFLLAGVLFKSNPEASPKAPVLSRLIIATGATALVTMLILKSMTLEWDKPISDYYLSKSKTEAYGANVVNVILVDFRALDTLGEIVVLAIAALGATAALGAPRRRAPLPGSSNTPWISLAYPVLGIVLIPTALWIFWRGHNAPGGGFIAALLIAAAVGLGLLISHRGLGPKKIRHLSRRLLIAGLTLATLSALAPLTVGKPFFTGLWWHSGDLHLGTPLLFDLGVMLTVIGFALSYLRHYHLTTPTSCKS